MPDDYTAPLASRIVDIATTLIADARHLPSDTAALTLADKVLRDLQRLVEDCRAPSTADRVYLLRELAARGVAPQRVFFAVKLDLASHSEREAHPSRYQH